jgi:hypothetical protein
MTPQQACEILKLHNQWRRSDEDQPEMQDPREIGQAIDTIVSFVEKIFLYSDGQPPKNHPRHD